MSLQRTFYFFGENPQNISNRSGVMIGADGSESNTIAELNSKISSIQGEIKTLQDSKTPIEGQITSNQSQLAQWQSDLDKKQAECSKLDKVLQKKRKGECENDRNFKAERVAYYTSTIGNLNKELIGIDSQIGLKKAAILTIEKSIKSINDSRTELASKGLTPEVLQVQAQAQATAIKAKTDGEVKALQDQASKISDAQAKSIASQSGAKKWIIIGVGTALIVLITIIIIQRVRSKKKAKIASSSTM